MIKLSLIISSLLVKCKPCKKTIASLNLITANSFASRFR